MGRFDTCPGEDQRHLFYVAMVNEINFDLQQEAGRERDKGIAKEKEREGGIVAISVDFQSLPFPDSMNGL